MLNPRLPQRSPLPTLIPSPVNDSHDERPWEPSPINSPDPSRASSHQYYPGRMICRGKPLPLPRAGSAWVPAGIRPPLVPLIRYVFLPYINVILLVCSKSMRTKFCKIKSKKITTAYKTFSTNDPAKRDPERMIIEPTMLNFRPG